MPWEWPTKSAGESAAPSWVARPFARFEKELLLMRSINRILIMAVALGFVAAFSAPALAFECPRHFKTAQAAIDKATKGMKGMSKMMPKKDMALVHALIDDAKTALTSAKHNHAKPTSKMAKLRLEGNTKDFFGSHFYGRTKEYIHAEKLTNLDKIPEFGFTVSMFPIKIERASGSWIRAVAIIDE